MENFNMTFYSKQSAGGEIISHCTLHLQDSAQHHLSTAAAKCIADKTKRFEKRLTKCKKKKITEASKEVKIGNSQLYNVHMSVFKLYWQIDFVTFNLLICI